MYAQPTWDDVHDGIRRGVEAVTPQLRRQREEIERLRAALHQIIEHWELNTEPQAFIMAGIAREVLKRPGP